MKPTGLIVDNFAGGGGASLGIELALGRPPDIAINHDPEALAMHQANHPGCRHFCENVWEVDPRKVCEGRPVDLAWFSPDCKHFSKAKGGQPVEQKIRGLAWVVIRWANAVAPRVIVLENVEEFQTWGPLLEDGRPCPARRGQTFRAWWCQLERLGYRVEMRELRACDYGTPTIRKRLFVIARRDGAPITWPEPTHGQGRLPYRTAAECIDWSLPCPSIFERKRPLADATLRRIARGIQRYVIEAAEPFVLTNTTGHCGAAVSQPLRTVTTGGHHALIEPFIAPVTHQGDRRCHPLSEPLRTVTGAHRGEQALVVPTLIQAGYGERPGQAPRVPGLEKPLGTVVAQGRKHAVVSAFLARHYGGMVGQDLERPIGTVTAVDHHSLVATSLVKLYGTCEDGQPMDRPMPTVTAGGNHIAEVRAFLVAYYGTEQDPQLRLPLHTVTTKDRFGLVTIAGQDYVITDIGMRMLQPRELFRAQGFPDSYRIDPVVNGKPLTKTAQVRMCGNSVAPPVAAAVVAAQLAAARAEEDAA